MRLSKKRKTTLRVTIFLLTLLIFFGGIGGAVWLSMGRQSEAGGQPNAVHISAPSRLEDVFIAAYLNIRSGDLSSPAGIDSRPITFTVEPGEAVGQIATRLQRAGLIRDAELFRLYLRYNGLDSRIEAGRFELNKTMTMAQIAVALQRGQREVTLAIPEGWRLEQVAEAAASRLPIDTQDFIRLARSPQPFTAQFPFLAELPDGATLEGYLFPDTYQFDREATAREVIEQMLANWDRKVPPELRGKLAAQNRSLFEAVILASIVEREAVVADERPIIAGVYMNRLQAGMALDADPTVQYAMGYQADQQTWWNRQLTQKDYRTADSPYNTYLYPGLPPGPICSPGLSSLAAAIEPDVNPYYFFRASCSGDGTHTFSKTLEEHAQKACP